MGFDAKGFYREGAQKNSKTSNVCLWFNVPGTGPSNPPFVIHINSTLRGITRGRAAVSPKFLTIRIKISSEVCGYFHTMG